MEIATTDRNLAADDLRSDFDTRFESVRGRLTAVCRAVIGVDDAPDLVQETYLRASERLHQLRDPDRFEAWVTRIALNESKGVRRRRRADQERLPKLVAVAPADSDAALRELVEHLPPRERAVIVLHYAYGYRMREIAALLDLSEINVRTVAHRARRRLRAEIEETAS